MLYHTARSDLKPYIAAGHQARSRAFIDLLTLARETISNAWTATRAAIRGKFGANFKHLNQPSSAMHA